METGDFMHIDIMSLISNLMIHSTSPIARRNTESLYTGDPFRPHVELPDDARNRSAEEVIVYLKTMGLKITFKAVPKRLINAFEIMPFEIIGNRMGIMPKAFTIEGEEETVELPCVVKSDGMEVPFIIYPFQIVQY